MNTQDNLNFKYIFLTNFLKQNIILLKELCKKYTHLNYDVLYKKYFHHIEVYLEQQQN